MARDIFHIHCKEALENASWIITNDPLKLNSFGQPLDIDIGAEQLIIGAEKENEQIAVEVKSFVRKSDIYSFHEALGQYVNYRRILKKEDPYRTLYLAVPEDVYRRFFLQPFAQNAIEEENLRLIVFNPITKTIITWIH